MDMTSSTGSKEIEDLGLDPRAFDFPKPVDLIKTICLAVTADDDLVLDFFAGSGTTGHAVFAANGVDSAKRRFILVQLPEPIDVAGAATIAALTRQRVGAASAVVTRELQRPDASTGFRAYSLEPSQFQVWDSGSRSAEEVDAQLMMASDHLVAGATEASMLTELLLKAAYALTSEVDAATFGGVPGYSVSEGALLVCLADSLTIEAFEAMVELEPAMILVLDAGFGGSDELKVNALQTVRARNQQSGSDIALRVV